MRASACRGSRVRMSSSHWLQTREGSRPLSAINRAKSSNQPAFSSQNSSNRRRSAAGAPSRNSAAATASAAVFHGMTRSKSTRVQAKIGRRENAAREVFKTDQQRIPRQRRETLIRRIAVTCRTQRQHLPQTLARTGKVIHETPRLRSEIPDAETPWQRCGMQNDSTGTRKDHSFSHTRRMPHVGIALASALNVDGLARSAGPPVVRKTPPSSMRLT